jgi:hypothetical protein
MDSSVLGPDLEPRQEKKVDIPNPKLQRTEAKRRDEERETLNDGGLRLSESECLNRWKARRRE